MQHALAVEYGMGAVLYDHHGGVWEELSQRAQQPAQQVRLDLVPLQEEEIVSLEIFPPTCHIMHHMARIKTAGGVHRELPLHTRKARSHCLEEDARGGAVRRPCDAVAESEHADAPHRPLANPGRQGAKRRARADGTEHTRRATLVAAVAAGLARAWPTGQGVPSRFRLIVSHVLGRESPGQGRLRRTPPARVHAA